MLIIFVLFLFNVYNIIIWGLLKSRTFFYYWTINQTIKLKLRVYIILSSWITPASYVSIKSSSIKLHIYVYALYWTASQCTHKSQQWKSIMIQLHILFWLMTAGACKCSSLWNDTRKCHCPKDGEIQKCKSASENTVGIMHFNYACLSMKVLEAHHLALQILYSGRKLDERVKKKKKNKKHLLPNSKIYQRCCNRRSWGFKVNPISWNALLAAEVMDGPIHQHWNVWLMFQKRSGSVCAFYM